MLSASRGDTGEIATVGAVGAELSTVTAVDAFGVPLTVPSFGVTVTTITSFLTKLVPGRVVAALTNAPLTVQLYA